MPYRLLEALQSPFLNEIPKGYGSKQDLQREDKQSIDKDVEVNGGKPIAHTEEHISCRDDSCVHREAEDMHSRRQNSPGTDREIQDDLSQSASDSSDEAKDGGDQKSPSVDEVHHQKNEYVEAIDSPATVQSAAENVSTEQSYIVSDSEGSEPNVSLHFNDQSQSSTQSTAALLEALDNERDRSRQRVAVIRKLRSLKARHEDARRGSTMVAKPSGWLTSSSSSATEMALHDREAAFTAERNRNDKLLVDLAKAKAENLALRARLSATEKAKKECEEQLMQQIQESLSTSTSRVCLPSLGAGIQAGPVKEQLPKRRLWRVSLARCKKDSFERPATTEPQRRQEIRYKALPEKPANLSETPVGERTQDQTPQASTALTEVNQIVNALSNSKDLLLQINLKKGSKQWNLQSAKVERSLD